MLSDKIRIWPDRVLLAATVPVIDFDADLAQLVAFLIATAKARGLGLAAPQIGLGLRVAVVTCSEQQPFELINPTITHRSARLIPWDEGCLSIPGEEHRTLRHEAVTVRYQTLSGEWKELQATGTTAIVVQHEVDHLHGRLYVDQLRGRLREEIRRKMLFFRQRR